MSENDIKIQLESCIINTRKVVYSFIENYGLTDSYTLICESVVLIHKYSLNIDEPINVLAPPPIKPNEDFFYTITIPFQLSSMISMNIKSEMLLIDCVFIRANSRTIVHQTRY